MSWFNGRSIEFFTVNGELAIRNLVLFGGFLVSSFIVSVGEIRGNLSDDKFNGYLVFISAVFGVAKWQDESTARNQATADATPAKVNVENISNLDTLTKSGSVNINKDGK